MIDWLEKNAADDFDRKFYDRVEYFGDTHIGWENTLKSLKVSLISMDAFFRVT